MEEKKNGGWSKATMVLGIITFVFALLPLLSAWFLFLTPLNWILAPIGIICGIVAIVKSQNMSKSIIGLVLCALAFLAPILFAGLYTASAVETTVNTLDAVNDIVKTVE